MKPTWIRVSSPLTIPPNAVPVDQGNIRSYVARATHEKISLATTAVANQQEVLVAWNGQVHRKLTYEILSNDDYKWQPADHKSVLPNAVVCGISEKGHFLFIGRATHNNQKIVGTIDAFAGTLHIPFEGRELQLRTYDILVGKELKSWQKATFDTIPVTAVVGGRDTDGAIIYVGRALHEGEHLPAKVMPSKRCCYIPWNGDDKYMTDFEVLTGLNYEWVKPIHNVIPPNAVSTGISRYGEPLYVGRAKYRRSLTPGLLRVSKPNLFVIFPYAGSAVQAPVFEILVKK